MTALEELLMMCDFKEENGHLVREWSKEVDVVFYGKMTKTYKVVVNKDYFTATFICDGHVEKTKAYTSSARMRVAIKNAVEYAGFKF